MFDFQGEFPDPIEQTKINMKVSSDGGAGLSRSSEIHRPTHMERLHRANFVIYVDPKNGVHVAKNRYGPHGKVSTKDLINIVTRILVEHIFDGRMKLFQEGMSWRLKGAINKIVKDGA